MAGGVCDLAPANSVIITTSTRSLLSAAFICGDPERHVLAGLSEAVSTCRVTGKRATAGRFKAKHSNKITRLVGRDEELRQLLALWESAKCGEGQVALICGEAGIGKSHLCEFLLGRIGEEPHATLRYQCSPHHLNSPFFPVISQLEHAMGFEQTDTPELKLQKLKASLSQAVEPTGKDIFLYAELLSTATPERERSRLNSTTAESSYNRRVKSTFTAPRGQAAADCRARGRALDRFQYTRVGQYNYSTDQVGVESFSSSSSDKNSFRNGWTSRT